MSRWDGRIGRRRDQGNREEGDMQSVHEQLDGSVIYEDEQRERLASADAETLQDDTVNSSTVRLPCAQRLNGQ